MVNTITERHWKNNHKKALYIPRCLTQRLKYYTLTIHHIQTPRAQYEHSPDLQDIHNTYSQLKVYVVNNKTSPRA